MFRERYLGLKDIQGDIQGVPLKVKIMKRKKDRLWSKLNKSSRVYEKSFS